VEPAERGAVAPGAGGPGQVEPGAIEPGAIEPGAIEHCTDEVCITCSDAAVAVTILEVRADRLALVETGAGPPEEVSIALVEAGVGDVVLVHAGEAIGVVAS
jgi:hydrogenase expression/formation protein HypC